uniref:CASP-like protein n=1 Tax=Ananas comosus var. bracteatus TaxID=296719 RepID=A0A6V7PN85_ANACO|nr:unnamed protein product [Ananas comosus var. bracteatus]
MENKALLKSEGLIRALCFVLSCITALVMCLNAQTKTVFFVQNKATPRIYMLYGFWAWLLQQQLLIIFSIYSSVSTSSSPGSHICVVLGDDGGTAGFADCRHGVGSFQWSKVCNIYTRFCVQVGGSLICGIAASLAMAVVSSLSAYRLFRLYPSVARSASPRRWRCWPCYSTLVVTIL